ncbi:MAG: hypothetical protein GY833_22045 [Aestuariibacter sp.]|nr:hypothetical protein [Aestuariibacter sp.]|tara:strand:+ start:60832 stop:61062 length:231 start_codon:yes stop_codon:yes gene_type:complete
MNKSFSFYHRNTHHWDVYSKQERIFRIRGEDGNFVVIGEHSCASVTPDGDWLKFKTLTAATTWITDYLMHEPHVAN